MKESNISLSIPNLKDDRDGLPMFLNFKFERMPGSAILEALLVYVFYINSNNITL
jgi:hypothetical protein